MSYNDLVYIFNGKFAYFVLGVLAATLAGSLGYFIWLLLERKTAKFYVKNAMSFLELVMVCYVVPMVPFLCFLLLKETSIGENITLVTTKMTICLSILTPLWVIEWTIVSVYHYIYYLEKCRMYRNSMEIQQGEIYDVLEKWKQRLGIQKKVRVYMNNDIFSPNIIYKRGYRILLPTDILKKEDYDIVILHELMHLKRRDLTVKNIGFVINIIHAFNPLVSKLRKQLEKWIEVACDFDCCEFAKEEITRKEYFGCLVDLKERSQDTKYEDVLCSFVENQELTEFRVDMMAKMKGESLKVPVWSYVLTLFLMCVITGGSLVFATGAYRVWYESSLSEMKEPLREETKEMTVEDLVAGSKVIYSEQQVLNKTKSTDFTVMPDEIWIFDVSEEGLKAVFVNIECKCDNYSVGCVGENGEIVYVDGKGDLAERYEVEDGIIYQIYVQNRSSNPCEVQMIVLKGEEEK